MKKILAAAVAFAFIGSAVPAFAAEKVADKVAEKKADKKAEKKADKK